VWKNTGFTKKVQEVERNNMKIIS